jgi:hypothetical protein
MPSYELPDRVSLEYLRKSAKDRLREMRATDPDVRLAAAQLAIAREHGFTSWRALKAEVDRRTTPSMEAFGAACASGDVGAIRTLLDRDLYCSIDGSAFLSASCAAPAPSEKSWSSKWSTRA